MDVHGNVELVSCDLVYFFEFYVMLSMLCKKPNFVQLFYLYEDLVIR